MVTTHGIATAANYYESTIQQKKDSSVKEKNKTVSEQVVKSSENKLSSRAKSYLDNLRKTYGDYDFIIADAGDDRRALLDKSDKEFSVMFSSAELERMATDENYANEKMRRVKTIVDMSDRICEQFGFERAWGKEDGSDTIMSKLSVSINDDGSMSLFAELEKMSEKNKDYLDKLQEKRLEEKKEKSYKKVVLEASSEEELIEKIQNVDWKKATDINVGARFDFSV